MARCEGEKDQSIASKNVCSQLVTTLREMANVYEGNFNKDDVDSIISFFQRRVGEMKKNIIIKKRMSQTVTGNQFVNSNISQYVLEIPSELHEVFVDDQINV